MVKKSSNSKYFSPVDLEIQENLSEDKLKLFSPIYEMSFDSPRPDSNFIDLMNWSQHNFSFALKDQENINKFIHNRIIIDGQFMQYCQENNITVECLYKDSIISWKTDSFYEKFFVQGVFLVKTNNVEFIHCALFHKGNQNEDEISFFNLVSEKNYYKYLLLRNSFDSWVQQRDRSNLHIRVIEGDDIPYTKDNAWDDLFLPNNIKLEIKNLVEGFLASKDFYSQNKMPWKRGVLLYGKPGCHAKGTPIMMADGSWKNAEQIEVGDYLMGPDSEPREVLKLVRGKENMYKIIPVKGKPFTVNENHILHLRNIKPNWIMSKVQDISVREFLELNAEDSSNLRLVKYIPPSERRTFSFEKNVDVTNLIEISSVEAVGVDDFYGFTVDKDHLYVMDDFWITHNCGKSSIIRTIMSEYNFKPVTILPGADDHSIRDAFAYAEEQSPSLLYFEDLDSILEKNDISSFLNLMDGIAAKNGLLVVATANEIKKLKPSITDRPSRFDRKFEIPLPDQEMSLSYLKKWFGNLVTIKKCKEIAKCAEKHEFSYAYLKDIYISSMFEALSNNRKTPTEKDIDTSLNRLIKEKNINNKSINMDKYFK